jgi:thiol-disulfide isomerase/thioredoxin
MTRRSVGALVGCLLLTACSSLGSTNDNGYIEGEGNVVQYAVDDRSEAVEISAPTLDGDELDLADYRGQVVVMNSWGSWCAPCNREMPLLVEAAAQLGDRAAFVGISSREPSRENALAFERAFDVTYPSYDATTDPSVLLAFEGAYKPTTTPSTAVLDREGRVAAVISGEVPSTLTLVQVVEDVLAEDA